MTNLSHNIKTKNNVTLLDGGMGRELKRIGAPFKQPEWSALALMQAPEYVTQAHLSFINAGAQVITTNNYAVVPFHIGQDRFEQQGAELTDRAGKLALEAARTTSNVHVAGSIPPLYGSYRPDLFTPASAAKDFDLILPALYPHIDFWLAETVSCLAELSAILLALEKLHNSVPAKPIWVSLTLKDQWQAEKPVLRSGESIAAAFSEISHSSAEAILFNCSQPEFISAAVKEATAVQKNHTKLLQIGAYANTFPPRKADANASAELSDLRDELTPQRYLAFAQQWRNDGATLIGGCCGIGPEHIQALHQWFIAD
jgi:homocysteine S-methyltransferase